MQQAEDWLKTENRPILDEELTRAKVQELKKVLASMKCVQAGWAFGVPEDGRELWLDLVVRAMIEHQGSVRNVVKRECKTKIYSNDAETRDYDRRRYGHDVHECVILLESGQVHDGHHRCSCNLSWAQIPPMEVCFQIQPGHEGKIQVANGEPSEKIMIVARNLSYMQEWCRIHEINPRSQMVRFVRSINDLRGITGSYYVDLGTDDQYIRELLERLKSLNVIRPILSTNV